MHGGDVGWVVDEGDLVESGFAWSDAVAAREETAGGDEREGFGEAFGGFDVVVVEEAAVGGHRGVVDETGFKGARHCHDGNV